MIPTIGDGQFGKYLLDAEVSAGPVFLDFEGALIGSTPMAITTFYDTAPQDYGVVFSGSAQVALDVDLSEEPSPEGETILMPGSGVTTTIMDVAAGFSSPLTFYWNSSGLNTLTLRDSGGSLLVNAQTYPSTSGEWVLRTVLFTGAAVKMEITSPASFSFGIDGMTLNPV